jgi:hypothetical protein
MRLLFSGPLADGPPRRNGEPPFSFSYAMHEEKSKNEKCKFLSLLIPELQIPLSTRKRPARGFR